MGKHTPGPWNDGIYHAVKQGGRTLAYITAPGHMVPLAAVPIEVDGYGREEGEANCRIMTAAPEMLEILKQIQALPGAAVDIERAGLGDDFRRAIAKAEGQNNG